MGQILQRKSNCLAHLGDEGNMPETEGTMNRHSGQSTKTRGGRLGGGGALLNPHRTLPPVAIGLWGLARVRQAHTHGPDPTPKRGPY